MKLNRSVMINVLNKGLGFATGSDRTFGKVVLMSAEQAFDFALVTGASYLTSEYGLVISGRLTIFYHRNYSFTPGLFNRDHGTGSITDGDSPLTIGSLNPRVFEGNKHVIFVEIEASSNIEPAVYNQLKNSGKDPSDYILTKVMPTGAGAEHFCEYVACMIFNRLNYLTESQPPWSYYGNPDFAAYKLQQLSELWERGFIQEGCLVQHLSTMAIFGKRNTGRSPDFPKEYEFVVGEAKTLSTNCVGQLQRYLHPGLCTSAYEIIPHKITPESGYGLVSFSQDGTINVHQPRMVPELNFRARKDDEDWFLNYAKMYLIANLPVERIRSFVKRNVGSKRLTPMGLIKFIRKLSVTSVLDEVEDYLLGCKKVGIRK